MSEGETALFPFAEFLALLHITLKWTLGRTAFFSLNLKSESLPANGAHPSRQHQPYTQVLQTIQLHVIGPLSYKPHPALFLLQYVSSLMRLLNHHSAKKIFYATHEYPDIYDLLAAC